MSSTNDTIDDARDRERDADAELDADLARLACVELAPLAARAQLLAAQRRLAQRAPVASRLERCEPAFLWALSALHLLWAALRVFSGTLH